jgi:hypothetical protein
MISELNRRAGRRTDGAAFAGAHCLSPFRARCERRAGGVGRRGTDIIAKNEALPSAFLLGGTTDARLLAVDDHERR